MATSAPAPSTPPPTPLAVGLPVGQAERATEREGVVRSEASKGDGFEIGAPPARDGGGAVKRRARSTARKPAAAKKKGEGRTGNTHAHLGGAGLAGRDGSEGTTGGSRGVIGEPEGGRGGFNAKEASREEKRTVRRGRVDREIAEMGKSKVQAVLKNE